MADVVQTETAAAPEFTVQETETTEFHYPHHVLREKDPHYKAFHAAHERLKKLGKLTCWIDNADCDHLHPVELHHSLIEYALIMDVDLTKFEELYPEFNITSDDEFLDWIEGEGNLVVLCKRHHTGVIGIHSIHYPGWVVQRFMKEGVAPPEQKVTRAPKVHQVVIDVPVPIVVSVMAGEEPK